MFETLGALEHRVNEIVRLYNQAITTKNKVIFIKLSLGEDTYNRLSATKFEIDTPSHKSYRRENRFFERFEAETFHESQGYGFCLFYKIGYEYTAGKDKKYTFAWDKDNESNSYLYLDKSYVIIKWTRKREDVLKALVNESDKLAEKMAMLFNDDERLQIIMDSGQIKLLEDKKEE